MHHQESRKKKERSTERSTEEKANKVVRFLLKMGCGHDG